MAIQKSVKIMLWGVADGTSTQFSFDITTTPFIVGTGRRDLFGTLVNWGKVAPVAVDLVSGCSAVSVAGAVVTATVPVKAAGSTYEVVLRLIFP